MQPTQPPAGQDPYYGFAGCYRHPDRLTGVRCVRCDRPICPECQHQASVGFQCPDDVRAGRASARRGRTVVGAAVQDGPPLVSYSLIGLNVLAYVLTAISPGGTLADNSHSKLFDQWVLWPLAVGQNHDYLRLISSAFLHIGPLHILLNMFALYLIGPALEQVLGRWRFLSLYLLAALGSSVLCLLFDPINSASAGASGAIFGLFAAALLLSKRVGFNTTSLLITVGINFIFTFSVPGISKLGHIGGFIAGGLATLGLMGWTLQRRSLGKQLLQVQLASLIGLLVLLLGLTIWRTERIHSQLATLVNGSAARVTMPVSAMPDRSVFEVASSTVWTALGRTTPV
ncbi:MAG: rhomboid family intramembrane serine protease [Jatrophihabitantaceae bacterium]